MMPIPANANTGLWTVNVQDLIDGHLFRDDFFTVSDQSQPGFQENADDINLKIYPNPVKDELYVKLSLNTEKNIEISIISLDGKRMINSYVEAANDFCEKINLNDLSKGTYLLNIKIDDKIYSKKVFKR